MGAYKPPTIASLAKDHRPGCDCIACALVRQDKAKPGSVRKDGKPLAAEKSRVAALASALGSIIDLKAPFAIDPLKRAENAVREAQRIATVALIEQGLYCSECKGLCSCGGDEEGRSCGHCERGVMP